MWLMFEPESERSGRGIYEYVNMLFLFDVNAFVFANRTIRESNAELRRMFEAIGYLDAALSIAKWRATLGSGLVRNSPAPEGARYRARRSPAARGAGRELTRRRKMECAHHRVEHAGKTTFVRTLGVNAVLAQTLHTVCAADVAAPMLRVRSSIGRSDSILEGKSYYLAEVEAVLDLMRRRRTGASTCSFSTSSFAERIPPARRRGGGRARAPRSRARHRRHRDARHR